MCERDIFLRRLGFVHAVQHWVLLWNPCHAVHTMCEGDVLPEQGLSILPTLRRWNVRGCDRQGSVCRLPCWDLFACFGGRISLLLPPLRAELLL